MGQFSQFGLNGFKQGQTQFSQLHISLDPDKLESCNFLCSFNTVMHRFAKVTCRNFDHCKCPKIHLNIMPWTWIKRYVKLTELCLTSVISI